MDDERARALLTAERIRVEGLLAGTSRAGADDRDEANAGATWPIRPSGSRPSRATTPWQEGLQARLRAIEAAELRLAAGNYGRSIRSGRPIPDERLEADPTAELTVDEASAQEAGDDLTVADVTVDDAAVDDAENE